MVITPKLSAAGDGIVIAKNGLTATVPVGKDFDLILDAPLTSFSDKAKSSVKAGVTIPDPAYISAGSDGKLHITGKAVAKGRAKIVFAAYGKSYTAKVVAK